MGRGVVFTLRSASRRVVAMLVAAAFLLASPTVRADESLRERASGPWPTEKKIVFYTLFAVGTVSVGYSVFGLIQQQNAVAEHNGEFPRLGGRGDIDCATPEQCARLRAVRDDIDDWSRRIHYAVGIGVGAMVGAGMTALLWPNGRARVAPAVSKDGGSLSVIGRF